MSAPLDKREYGKRRVWCATGIAHGRLREMVPDDDNRARDRNPYLICPACRCCVDVDDVPTGLQFLRTRKTEPMLVFCANRGDLIFNMRLPWLFERVG